MKNRWSHVQGVVRVLGLGLVLGGCSERPVFTETGTTDEEPARPVDGDFAPCESAADCSSTPYCVFPEGESGYCAPPCTSRGDCPSSPFADAHDPECIDIGSPDLVCSLPCGGGGTCPPSMECNQVMLPGGAYWGCF